jgi:pSer/pThr/pTyr-binding forkhead associated (FHA) protein
MLRPGAARSRVEQILNAAYGDGLLSQQTLVQRLDLLFGSELVDPAGLVGDLMLRRPRPAGATAWRRIIEALRAAALAFRRPAEPATLLALDWSGVRDELLVGRHDACDVVVGDLSVSRQHARLSFRDGHWVLRDLHSTNGTRVNGTRVVRCRLEPGDRLSLGSAHLLVD